MWLWSGSMHVSQFVFTSACVGVFALSLSGRSAAPPSLLHHSPELSALSFSVSYGCVHLPSCFLIGCCRLLHWEGLLRQQRLNLGAGIFLLALVWKAERVREGGEKARANGRERERERENKRTRVTGSWVQAVYMQLKKDPEEDGKGDTILLFFWFFTVTVFAFVFSVLWLL